MITGHGDDLYNFNTDIQYNFSSNVYPGGPAPGLLAHLKSEISSIAQYPSPDARELSALTAERLGLNASQVIFTNGATEAFYLMAQCFKDTSAAVPAPAFAEYEDAARAHGLKTNYFNMRAMPQYHFTEKIAFFGHPNNPDGIIHPLTTIEKIISQYPETLFIADEAYIEFTEAAPDCLSLLNKYQNLAIIRSLTKTFVIPGLRLGYIIAPSGLIPQINQNKMPWNVNSLSIIAGKYITQHYDQLRFDVSTLRQQTEVFRQSLSSIKWAELWPTVTNYFLVKLKKGKASSLKKYLAEKHQILIRDANNFKGLEGEYIRLATQQAPANQALKKAMEEWKP